MLAWILNLDFAASAVEAAEPVVALSFTDRSGPLYAVTERNDPLYGVTDRSTTFYGVSDT